MKMRLKAAVAGLATAGLLASWVGAAFAATPPYEPNSVVEHGTLTFYNAAGQIVTSGSTTASPFVSFAASSGANHGTDDIATMAVALPNPSQPDQTQWGNGPLNFGNNYPDPSTPSSVTSTSSVYVGQAGDPSLDSFIASNPHPATDPSTYQGLYQVRMTTSGTNGTDNQYWVADILVSGTTWTQVYPQPVGSSTTLSVTPASPQNQGTNLTLTAAVAPGGMAGSVTFSADAGTPTATVLAANVPVGINGIATTTTNALTAGGHNLSASFTPTDTTNFTSSSSNVVPYSIIGLPPANTQTGLAANPLTQQFGSPVNFTATVSPTAVPGSVSFVADPGTPAAATLGQVSGSGTFVLASSGLAQGTHNVVATFTPAAGQNFNPSTSAPVQVVITAPAFAPDIQTIVGSIPAGTMTISTPYTPGAPLSLGTLQLNGSGTQFSATATFQNITVNDSRAGGLPITVKALSTNMTSGANAINSQNLGLTALVTSYIPGNGIVNPGNPVTTFDNAAADPAVGPADPGTLGLGGSSGHTIATVAHGAGSFTMNGTLTLNAPSSTPAGTYTGTITFTVG